MGGARKWVGVNMLIGDGELRFKYMKTNTVLCQVLKSKCIGQNVCVNTMGKVPTTMMYLFF